MKKILIIINNNLKQIVYKLFALAIILKEGNRMLEFIQNNSVTCVVLAIIIIALAVYFIKYRKDILKKAALYAVAKAEEAWGSNTGRIKFAEAYTYIKKNYPIITFFISEKQLSKLIEDALISLKEILATKSSIEKKDDTVENVTE